MLLRRSTNWMRDSTAQQRTDLGPDACELNKLAKTDLSIGTFITNNREQGYNQQKN